MSQNINRVQTLLSQIETSVLGVPFEIIVRPDQTYDAGRLFLQVAYTAPCTKTNKPTDYKGRKWYLSSHMTDDEIVKTAYAAVKTAVEHEVMEGFRIGGSPLFNPHTPYTTLMQVAGVEQYRKPFHG